MNDVTIRRPIVWASAEASDVGTVRQINEDSVLSMPQLNLWTVADGMGGHDGGSVASQMIVDALSQVTAGDTLNQTVCDIEHYLHLVNEQLLNYSRTQLNGRIVGSTVVSLLVKERVGICLWAGDSRLYRYRNGQFTAITRDHSHVQELLDQGLITEDQVDTHPESNVITRAVGTSDDLFLDITTFDVQFGDMFLLCSDGLYNAISEAEIVKHLNSNDIEGTVEQLITTSLNNNASDNVSVIVVKGSIA